MTIHRKGRNPRYVLITAAKNEGRFISRAINSVISQTIKPVRWIIVSDGSTDDTNDIVGGYAKVYSYIELVQLVHRKTRDFSSKVKAIRVGYKKVQDLCFDFVGNLDADVSFDTDYYEKLLLEFNHDLSLGIAGGAIHELHGSKVRRQWISRNSVAGANQMFRRDCYDKIGGYMALPDGGEDAVAGIVARMYGWKVRTFQHYAVVHHKNLIRKGQSWVSDRIRWGRMFYQIGYHPIFELARCIMRTAEHPLVFGAIFELIGYCHSALLRSQVKVPGEIVRYLRDEQVKRLYRFSFNGQYRAQR